MALASPETVDALGTFYAGAPLVLPEPMSRFHQHRLRMLSGKFSILRDTIRAPNDLRKWLVRLKPLDCYHGVNPFLSPANVSFNEFDGKRAGFNVANNVLLGDGVIVADTDYHDERSFEDARRDMLGIRDYFHERGYKERYISHTGRGFHVLVTDHDLSLPQTNPCARFEMYRKLREPLVKDLTDRGVHIDAEVTLNVKSIVRSLGTFNWLAGCKCIIVRDPEHFTHEGVERVVLAGWHRVTPKVEDDTRFFRRKIGGRPGLDAGCAHNTKASTLSQAAPTKPAIYLGTKILGTFDRQIILLRFPEPVDVKVLSERLSRFAIREQLAPFLIFRARKVPDTIWALSPSAVQFAGMKRLLRKFPTDRVCYQKFRRRLVPMPLEFIAETSGVTDSEIPASRAHVNYFQHYGLFSSTPKVLTGSTMLSTPIGEMRI